VLLRLLPVDILIIVFAPKMT